MLTRKLGRTGLHVPVIGFGGARMGIGSPQKCVLGQGGPKWDEAVKIIQAAYKMGIKYFDTSRGYADSDEKIGYALKDVRDEVIIATKCQTHGRKETERLLRHSFRNLQTDVLDIVQLHSFDHEHALKRALGPDGALEALKEARKKGKIRFIGITGHNPFVLTRAIKTGEFDTVLAPLNAVEREALEELIPTAKELDVGIVAMKAFIISRDQVYDFVHGPEEIRRLYGTSPGEQADRVLRYVIGHDISVVIVGFTSIPEIRNALMVAENFNGLSEEEKKVFRFGQLPPEPWCRECGKCLPCPEFIYIPAILRYYKFFTFHNMENYSRNHYRALSTRANVCTKCGECEPRCPFRLPIIKMLQEADETLRERHLT